MMWLKNKLIRNIVISVVALGVLGGIYAAVMLIPQKANSRKPSLLHPMAKLPLLCLILFRRI